MSYYNRIKHAGHATKVPEIPRNSTTTNMNSFYSDHNKSKSSREKAHHAIQFGCEPPIAKGLDEEKTRTNIEFSKEILFLKIYICM